MLSLVTCFNLSVPFYRLFVCSIIPKVTLCQDLLQSSIYYALLCIVLYYVTCNRVLHQKTEYAYKYSFFPPTSTSDTVQFYLEHNRLCCSYLIFNADCSSATHTHTHGHTRVTVLPTSSRLPSLPYRFTLSLSLSLSCLCVFGVFLLLSVLPCPQFPSAVGSPTPSLVCRSCSSSAISPSVCRGLLTAR